jgi:hypothetical protein
MINRYLACYNGKCVVVVSTSANERVDDIARMARSRLPELTNIWRIKLIW